MKTMNRMQTAFLAVVTTVALVLTGCNFFSPPAATVAAGPQGTVSFKLIPVAPAVYSVFKAPARAARGIEAKAFLSMDSVAFELYLGGTLVDSWYEYPSATAIIGENQVGPFVSTQSRPIPVASGYILKAKVYNNYTSSAIPVVVGESAAFDVAANANTPVSITCVPPYDADNPASYLTINLAQDTVNGPFQLATPWNWDTVSMSVSARGSEQWFRAVPANYWTAFKAVPDVISGYASFPVVIVYDAIGNLVGSGSGIGNGTPAMAVVSTVPGNTYYVGVIDFAGTASGGRMISVSYSVAPPVEEALGTFGTWIEKTLQPYQPKMFYFDVNAGDTVQVYWSDAYYPATTWNFSNGGADIRAYGYLSDKTTAWFSAADSGFDYPYAYTLPVGSASPSRIYVYVESWNTGGSGKFGLKADYQPYVATNDAPNAFSLNWPVSGNYVYGYPVQLSWVSTTDPNVGDTVTYDIYCDMSNPPLTKVGSTANSSFDLTGLTTPYAIYYWQVKATDGKGGVTASNQIGSFLKYFANSAPNAPVLQTPTMGQLSVSRNPTLTWTGSDPDNDPLTYNIYLDTSGAYTQIASGVVGTSYTVPFNLMSYYSYSWKVEAVDPSSATTASATWSFQTSTILGHYLTNYSFQQGGWSDYAGMYTDSSTWWSYGNVQGSGDYVPNWTFELDPYYLWNGPINIQMRTTEPGAADANVVYMADTNNNYTGYGMSMSQQLSEPANVTVDTKLKLRFKIISYAGGNFVYSYYEAPLKVYVMMWGNWYLMTGFTVSPYSANYPGEVVPADSWVERDIALSGFNMLSGYTINQGTSIQGIRIECNGWAWQVLVDTVDLHE